MKEVYDFATQNKLGKEMEKKTMSIISDRLEVKIMDVSDNPEFRKDGFDFAFQLGEKINTVEVKTDFQSHCTGNAFLEMVNNFEQAGWMVTSAADFLMYVIYEEKRALFLKMSDIRNLLKTKSFASKECKNRNYSSFGKLVPIVELEKIGNWISFE